MRFLLHTLLFGCLLVCTATAQTLLPQPAPILSRTASGSAYALDWQGFTGRSYFVQRSFDLKNWSYFPILAQGAPEGHHFAFGSDAAKMFVRLYHVDSITTWTDDFDIDGLSNGFELDNSFSIGLDPLRIDSNSNGTPDGNEDPDGDGLTNAQEQDHDTLPDQTDSDGDGVSDAAEVASLTNPRSDLTQTRRMEMKSVFKEVWQGVGPSVIKLYLENSEGYLPMIVFPANQAHYSKMNQALANTPWPDFSYAISDNLPKATGQCLYNLTYQAENLQQKQVHLTIPYKADTPIIKQALVLKSRTYNWDNKEKSLEGVTFVIPAGSLHSEAPYNLEPTFSSGNQENVVHEFIPFDLVSRDRFLAGSLRLPDSMDELEIEFVNTTTNENLGKYGQLLSNEGLTKIHAKQTDILAVGGIVQPESQKVWFVRDSVDPRKIQFYTCFNNPGEVELRFHLQNQQIGYVKHNLELADDFGRWINGIDAWVGGQAFGTTGGPMYAGAAMSAPPRDASIFDLSSDGDIDHYTRALLIPIFNVVATVRGGEALFRGIIDGICQGGKDDWEFINLVWDGTVLAGSYSVEQAKATLLKWQQDPLVRSQELMAMIVQNVERHIIEQVKNFHPRLKLRNWDDWTKAAWEHWRQTAETLGTIRHWVVSKTDYLSESLTEWMDDFATRMGQQAEKTAWTNTPWQHDPLLAGTETAIATFWYSIGYSTGYISEQIAVGIVTGGTVKIAQVLGKGAIHALTNLSRRSVQAAWLRLHLIKKELANPGIIHPAFRKYMQEGMASAGKKPVNEVLQKNILEELEEAMLKAGVDRSKFNCQTLVDAICEKPKLRQLVEQSATKEVIYQRLVLLAKLLDNELDDAVMKNFLEVADKRLIYESGDGTMIEYMEDYLRAFKGNPAEFVNWPPLESLTAQQKSFLKQVLSEPDTGDIWKLDDPVWANGNVPPYPHNYWTRGIIGEILVYEQKYRPFGYTHLPIEKAIDYTGLAAVQAKFVKNPSGAVDAMKTAIRDLLAEAPEGPVKLHVLHKPGTDGVALKDVLDQYRLGLNNIVDRERLLITVDEYSTKL